MLRTACRTSAVGITIEIYSSLLQSRKIDCRRRARYSEWIHDSLCMRPMRARSRSS
jgi:hypothetical protein